MFREKKMTGRFSSLWGGFLLFICMLFCLLTDMQVEAAEAQTYGDWRYIISEDGTVTILKYNGKETEIVIPGMIDGKSVTEISSQAFMSRRELSSITIPTGVTSIGSSAFQDCESLSSITIPGSVTIIGSRAFQGCRSLSSITIPTSVTKIGDNAFLSCRSLSSITIPASVTSIGFGVFSDCGSLTSINVAENSQSYTSKDGILYDKSCNTIICCPGKKQGTVTIPSSVTSISYGAFQDCSSLTNIEIPSRVTFIGDNAFQGCSSLTSIEIPSSVTFIGAYAFWGCSSITSIEIPSSVTSIKNYAFWGCSSITSIEIPSSVTSIGNSAFKDCSSLTSITIPNSVESIGSSAFEDCSSLTSITIPGSVTSIGTDAFKDCSSDLTIYGEPGSCAEEYMKENGMELKCSHTLVPDPVIDPAIDPTCTENGRTEGSHCFVCGEAIKEQEVIPATGHTLVIDEKVAPTCTEPGKTAGSHCKICKTVIKEQETIPATGHAYKQTIYKEQATTKKNGIIITKCSTCGEIKETAIYAASGIKLSKTSFTYNGKNQKPAITIKDSNGKALSAGSYKVTYPKTSKKAGEYTVTITLQGNYSGTVELTYQIKPKGSSISKLTAKKKGLTAKWKKQTKQTTGYQLQYSTSKKFKGAKTVTVKKNKTTSKSITKLKAGKKYYVRMRTYKTVKVNGKSVKLCSGWSKVKSVKTKK